MKNFCLETLSNAERFQGTRNVEPALYPLPGYRGSLILPSPRHIQPAGDLGYHPGLGGIRRPWTCGESWGNTPPRAPATETSS